MAVEANARSRTTLHLDMILKWFSQWFLTKSSEFSFNCKICWGTLLWCLSQWTPFDSFWLVVQHKHFHWHIRVLRLKLIKQKSLSFPLWCWGVEHRRDLHWYITATIQVLLTTSAPQCVCAWSWILCWNSLCGVFCGAVHLVEVRFGQGWPDAMLTLCAPPLRYQAHCVPPHHCAQSATKGGGAHCTSFDAVLVAHHSTHHSDQVAPHSVSITNNRVRWDNCTPGAFGAMSELRVTCEAQCAVCDQPCQPSHAPTLMQPTQFCKAGVSSSIPFPFEGHRTRNALSTASLISKKPFRVCFGLRVWYWFVCCRIFQPLLLCDELCVVMIPLQIRTTMLHSLFALTLTLVSSFLALKGLVCHSSWKAHSGHIWSNLTFPFQNKRKSTFEDKARKSPINLHPSAFFIFDNSLKEQQHCANQTPVTGLTRMNKTRTTFPHWTVWCCVHTSLSDKTFIWHKVAILLGSKRFTDAISTECHFQSWNLLVPFQVCVLFWSAFLVPTARTVVVVEGVNRVWREWESVLPIIIIYVSKHWLWYTAGSTCTWKLHCRVWFETTHS